MNIPQKCQNCFKHYNKTVVHSCEICNKFQFPEENLCELLRNKKIGFNCAAYKPKLQLLSDTIEVSESEDNPDIHYSQRNKWIQSYLVQQQKQNPDQIQFKLRYHIMLITHERSPVLSDKYFSSLSKIFENTAKQFYDTTIDLLWVAFDHVHLYLDSSPDFSVDEIYQKMLNQSERVIYMKHPELKPENQNLWERSYFVETLG